MFVCEFERRLCCHIVYSKLARCLFLYLSQKAIFPFSHLIMSYLVRIRLWEEICLWPNCDHGTRVPRLAALSVTYNCIVPIFLERLRYITEPHCHKHTIGRYTVLTLKCWYTRRGVCLCVCVCVCLSPQDREKNSVGLSDGWLELHDPLLQEQLLRWL